MARLKIPLPPLKVGNALPIYCRLFKYMRRYWLALLLAGIGTLVYSGVDAWFVYFLKPLMNKGLVERNAHFLYMAPLLVLGVFILRGAASFLSNYFIAQASRNVIMRVRQDLFRHMQRLPANYYDKTTSGKMLSVLLYCVDQISNASADVLTTAAQAICLIIGLVIVMFSISVKLTLLYFTIAPLVTVIMRIVSLRIRRLSLGIQQSIADINHHAEENVEGYKAVRIFAGQESEVEKFDRATRVNRQREMKVVTARAISVAAIQLVTAIALSLTLYIATFNVLLTPGGFVAIIASMLALLKPMKDISSVQNKLYRGLAGAQQVFEVMDEKEEVDLGTQTLVRASGSIAFSHLAFEYSVDNRVLSDISFTIEPGEVVALVGRSGSGKSTLINLLMRFYDYEKGHIYLDGTDIREYKLSDLRQQFSLVSQHVTLFYDSIYNNIAYGDKNASKAAIEEAARMAHALDFINEMPNGFDAIIGENGLLLSGGERQRIAIARAMLKDAPILILDEATSALDTESERMIQAAFDELMKNRTTLVVAHRLSTIEKADKIIVMDHGRIVEMGNHQTLLAKQGYYAKLHRMQFSDALMMDTADALD